MFRLLTETQRHEFPGNFQLCRGHCQLHARFFALLAALPLLLAGCREGNAPGYERLRAQLLREAFGALNGRDPDRALLLLGRLEDLSPDQPFWRLAAAREAEHWRLAELNRLVSMGEFEKAQAFIRSETTKSGVSGALSKAVGLPEALLAVQAYACLPPPTDSHVAQNALRSLEPHRALLKTSPTFVKWHKAEVRRYEALRDGERREHLTRLLDAYDQAVVAGSRTDSILRQFQRQAPKHAIVTFSNKARKGRWSEILATARQNGNCRAAIELLACQQWPDIPEPLAAWITSARPPHETMAGILVHALISAERGKLVPLRASLARLPVDAHLADRYVSHFLEIGVLPKTQFAASCWRAPFPSVTDMLNRVVQVREHYQAEEK